jgi:hypothetical protein
VGPSSWRELLAVLMALRMEVVAGYRLPVVGPSPAVTSAAEELVGDQPDRAGPGGADDGGAVLRRIDALTAAALGAVSLGAVFFAHRSGGRGAAVITNVVRGWRPAGLLAYELAPGRLVAAVQAPAVAAGLPTGASAERGERGDVRHCSG